MQARLRKEILSCSKTKTPPPTTVEEHNNLSFEKVHPGDTSPPAYHSATQSAFEAWDKIELLPYLDAVVRETLRLCPPVHSTIRVATSDDQIPISHPVVLQDGTVVEKGGFISIRKGSYIHIPIEGLNCSTEVWGSDALKFK